MKCYSDFIYGDKKISDFGGTLYNEDGFRKNIGSNPNHITLSIPNKGDIYYGIKYDPIEIDLPCYFEARLSEREIASWICGEEERRFQYIGDTKYCNAVYNGKLEFEIYGGDTIDQSLTNIPLISYDGFWRAIEEPQIIENPTINTVYLINGNNNIASYPTFKITPRSSTVNIKWNDMYIALKNIEENKEYILDGENGDFYYLSAESKIYMMPCLYTDDYYTMPTLKPFVQNELTVISGSVKKIEIIKNSRIRE